MSEEVTEGAQAPSTYQVVDLPRLKYTESGTWREHAKCRSMGTTLFYAQSPVIGASRKKFIDKAKKVCSECPVTNECFNFAVKNEEHFGVWGGVDFFKATSGYVWRQRQALLNNK